MTNPNEILQLAQQRAVEKSLPYSGALTPREAFDVMQRDPSVVLVDVRSRAELELVGRVPESIHIEWAFYPGMVPNAQFSEQLAESVDKNLTIVFMCRTGGRSHSAAVVAHEMGYDNVYNMLEGFEGEANSLKQRTLVNGWKHAGLPWSN